MNMHPFLQQLLAGQAVEWKPLGEICDIKKGKQLNKVELKEQGLYPAYNGGKTYSGWADCYNVEANTIIISQGGASAGFVNFITVPFWANAHCYYLLPNLEFVHNRYLYHFLKYNENYFMESQYGAGIPALSQAKLNGLSIPIPPLSVQTKIAQILDTMTAITAELTAELSMRNKQYQYYRDKLLSENELAKVGFEWKSLGEVLIRTKGTKITAGQMKELHKENAPLKIFAGGKTFALVDFDDIPQKDINTNPSVIVKSRGIIEFEYYDKPFSHKNEMWSYYSDNENILIKFVYYFLKSKESYFQQLGSKMQMPQIATPDTDKFLIPIPPLSAQTKIVQILDKFDTLTRSISDGLPREIELRQQQYEYYREMLLGFERE